MPDGDYKAALNMTVLSTVGARLAVLAILTLVGELLRNLKCRRNPVLLLNRSQIKT